MSRVYLQTLLNTEDSKTGFFVDTSRDFTGSLTSEDCTKKGSGSKRPGVSLLTLEAKLPDPSLDHEADGFPIIVVESIVTAEAGVVAAI